MSDGKLAPFLSKSAARGQALSEEEMVQKAKALVKYDVVGIQMNSCEIVYAAGVLKLQLPCIQLDHQIERTHSDREYVNKHFCLGNNQALKQNSERLCWVIFKFQFTVQDFTANI